MSYPKTFTSRYDHHASVVVMNAEQEAELPAEFRAADSNNLVGAGGQAGAGGISKDSESTGSTSKSDDVLLTPEYGAVVVDREKLERDRTEFAELMAKEQKELADGKANLQQERAQLTASYKADKQKLDEDREALDTERKLFENTKAGAAPHAKAKGKE